MTSLHVRRGRLLLVAGLWAGLTAAALAAPPLAVAAPPSAQTGPATTATAPAPAAPADGATPTPDEDGAAPGRGPVTEAAPATPVAGQPRFTG